MTDIKTYRRIQCSAYREEVGDCQVTAFLRSRSVEFIAWERNHHIGGLAIHHIFGRGHRDMESFCNLILVGTAAHEFGHQSTTPAFSVTLAFEAVCLMAKLRQQQRLDLGAERSLEPERQHWSISQLDLVRSHCVGYRTIRSRIEFLYDELRNGPFGDVVEELRLAI